MNRSLGIVALVISVLSLSLVPVYGNAATAYIVSGMVSVPGGVIASNDKTHGVSLAGVLDFFIPSAEARLYGLLPVPNGTPVELVRMGDRGYMSAPIATTTTQYGRYRFNLSALRLTVSPRLVVRVGNVATGAQMRAFVTDKTLNINPVSETTVRLVLDTVASTQGGTLGNFTVTELEDLFGSLDLLTSSLSMRTDADIESSVLAVRNAVAGNRGIVNFLTACARPGQTSAGPGDIGNYFPFTQGVSWTYTIQETEDGIASRPYKNTVKVNGTRLVNGVATTVFKESNPDGDGKPDYFYYRKISSGGFDWTPVKDGSRKTPYRAVRFPAVPGSSFKQSIGDFRLNADIDRDGIVERFNFTATTTVLGLETVSVPAGTLRNSLKIRTVATGSATMSSTRKKIAVTDTQFEWYTQNLGLAKLVDTIRITYDSNVWKDTHTQELTNANGFPFTGDFPLDRWTSLDIESNDIAYDRVSGKLFASVPSYAPKYADNIVVINAVSAKVEAAIPVGANPGPLAVSDDGQFLYVGLGSYGEQGSIRQISIPTLSAGPEWTLGDAIGDQISPNTHLYARDIAVQAGNPEVILITTSTRIWPYAIPWPYNFAWPYAIENDIFYCFSALILDHGTERPITVGPSGSNPCAIESSNNSNIAYGYDWGISGDQYLFSVDSDGVRISETRSGLTVSGLHDFKYGNGRIYTNTGAAFDAETGVLMGTYTSGFSGYQSIESDSTFKRVAMAYTGYNNALTIDLFDMNSYSKLDEHITPAKSDEYPTHLESLGVNGYAIRVLYAQYLYVRTSRIVLTKFAKPN